MEDVKKNILNTGIMNILAMIVLYVVAYFLFRGIQLDTTTLLGTILTLLFGFIPAFLWLSFYYFLDRKDPEPVIMVALGFLAGILSEVVFSTFIGETLFNIGIWNLNVNAMPTASMLFTRGFIPALAIYIVIRYFFYPSKHFNEPVDGMMYGSFIGIGYALMASLEVVFEGGLVTLYYLVFSLLIRLALFSSLGALIGYYFGKARFNEEKKQLYFLVAIIISFGVFTLYAYLDSLFQTNITTSSDIYSIILVLAFTVVLLGIVFFLIQRSLTKGEVKELKGTSFFMDAVSIIALVLVLGAGITIRIIKEGDKTFKPGGENISFTIPSEYRYLDNTLQDNFFVFTKKLKDERYPVNIKITVTDGYEPLSFFNLIAMEDNQFKVDDFVVTVNISQEVIKYQEELKKDFKSRQGLGGERTLPMNRKTLDTSGDPGGQTYLATIHTYSAEKQGMKLNISVEFPGPDFPEPRNLARKIISSFKKEA